MTLEEERKQKFIETLQAFKDSCEFLYPHDIEEILWDCPTLSDFLEAKIINELRKD